MNFLTQLLDKVLTILLGSRSHSSATAGHADTAQLLLVLSDGNGMFREGMDVVRKAVRRARSARIFLVFIVLDNPGRKVFTFFSLHIQRCNPWFLTVQSVGQDLRLVSDLFRY